MQTRIHTQNLLDEGGTRYLVEQLVQRLVTGNIDLTDYVKKDELQEIIDGLDINIDLSDYATEQYVREQIAQALVGDDIDLSDYVTKEQLENALKDVNLEGYATEEWVLNKIAESVTGESCSCDLSPYATKEYVDNLYNQQIYNRYDFNMNFDFSEKTVYFDKTKQMADYLDKEKTYRLFFNIPGVPSGFKLWETGFVFDGISYRNVSNVFLYRRPTYNSTQRDYTLFEVSSVEDNGIWEQEQNSTWYHYDASGKKYTENEHIDAGAIKLKSTSKNRYYHSYSEKYQYYEDGQPAYGEPGEVVGTWENGWHSDSITFSKYITTPCYGVWLYDYDYTESKFMDESRRSTNGEELMKAFFHCVSKIVDKDGNEIPFKIYSEDGEFEDEVDNSKYATKVELNTKANKVHTHLLNDITDYEAPNLDDYALKSEIPNTDGFLTSIPEEYTTETEVNTLIDNKLGVIENGSY